MFLCMPAWPQATHCLCQWDGHPLGLQGGLATKPMLRDKGLAPSDWKIVEWRSHPPSAAQLPRWKAVVGPRWCRLDWCALLYLSGGGSHRLFSGMLPQSAHSTRCFYKRAVGNNVSIFFAFSWVWQETIYIYWLFLCQTSAMIKSIHVAKRGTTTSINYNHY